MLNFVHITYQYYLKMQKYIQTGPFGLETYKPQHDKTNKMSVPSLIRIFAVHSKGS